MASCGGGDGLGHTLDRRVASGAFDLLGAEGADTPPLFGAAGQAGEGGLGAAGQVAGLPTGVGGRVVDDLQFVTTAAVHGVPVRVEFAVVVASATETSRPWALRLSFPIKGLGN